MLIRLHLSFFCTEGNESNIVVYINVCLFVCLLASTLPVLWYNLFLQNVKLQP